MSQTERVEYYEDELAKIKDPDERGYAIKITASKGDTHTKWLGLNEDSARVLVRWLVKQYIPIRHIPRLIEELNEMI